MFLLTFLFCFLAFEYGFGSFYYSNVSSVSDKQYDPILGWQLKPGLFWIKSSESFSKHQIFINEFGLRSKHPPKKRNEKEKKILILGDSFTYGKQISDENIFPNRIEEILNSNNGEEKYEVINAGVPGYGTAQELLLMKKLSEQGIKGDICLLMIFTNDILDNLRLSYGEVDINQVQPGFIIDSTGQVDLKFPPQKNTNDTDNFISGARTITKTGSWDILKRRLESFMQTKPGLINFLNEIGINVKFPRMPGLMNGWYREDLLTTGIPLLKGLIGKLKNEIEDQNSKLLVSIIPSPIQVYSESYGILLRETFPDNDLVEKWFEDKLKPQRYIKSICEDLKIPYLDLFPVLVGQNDDELYIPRDGHFNENGHEIAAQHLSNFITEYGDEE